MNRLKELRKQMHVNQETLGELLGVQKSAICKYETGRVRLPNDAVETLCNYFDVTADYLLGIDRRDNVRPMFRCANGVTSLAMEYQDTVGVPVMGMVHAGLPMLAEENISEYVYMPSSEVVGGEFFFMQVEGDCMTGDYIPEGALVLVQQDKNVRDGAIAVVRVGEEVLVRRIKRMKGALLLIASNPKYEPMILSGENVEVIGRVREIRIRNL